MTRLKAAPEVYAREINEESTLRLFLRGRLYGCRYQKGGHLASARYFAPHFGMQIADRYPGVQQGISHVAQIEDLVPVRTWADFLGAVRKNKGNGWLRRNHAILREARRWHWREKGQKYFLFLGEPRLVFNPPINKGALQSGKGWLSKRNLTFEELFEAWKKGS